MAQYVAGLLVTDTPNNCIPVTPGSRWGTLADALADASAVMLSAMHSNDDSAGISIPRCCLYMIYVVYVCDVDYLPLFPVV